MLLSGILEMPLATNSNDTVTVDTAIFDGSESRRATPAESAVLIYADQIRRF